MNSAGAFGLRRRSHRSRRFGMGDERGLGERTLPPFARQSGDFADFVTAVQDAGALFLGAMNSAGAFGLRRRSHRSRRFGMGNERGLGERTLPPFARQSGDFADSVTAVQDAGALFLGALNSAGAFGLRRWSHRSRRFRMGDERGLGERTLLPFARQSGDFADSVTAVQDASALFLGAMNSAGAFGLRRRSQRSRRFGMGDERGLGERTLPPFARQSGDFADSVTAVQDAGALFLGASK